MPITDRQIEQAYSELKSIHGGVRGDYFGLLYLEQELNLPREKAIRQNAFGGHDYGIDGFHIDTDRRNLYLFQFKQSTDDARFKESFKRLTNAGMERVFGNPLTDNTKNQLLLQLDTRLMEDKNLIDQVLVHFVFQGDPEVAERSLILDKLREDLEGKKYLLDHYFGRHVSFAIQFRAPNRVAAPTHVRVTHTYPIDIQQPILRTGPKGQKMHTGYVRLLDLAGMYRDMNQRFFERNIRSSLAEEKAPNLALYKALTTIVLDRSEDPSVFAFDHSGVTMFAEKLEQLDGKLQITEPRLLNGAQTVATLDRFLRKSENDPRLADGKEILGQIYVLCKIVSNADDPFVVRVTINNNRQNPVLPWNLRANDEIQLELYDKFLRDTKHIYERQENAFKSLSKQDLGELEIIEEKKIEILKLAQTFLASDGEIDRMSRMRDVFESDKQYTQVFNPSRLRADSRHIFLCYKVHFRLQRLIGEIIERGVNLYAYMTKGRNLLWALLCQGILNDPRLEERADEYGKSLVIESDFTEWLLQLSSTRARFVISEVVDKEPYATMVREERYSFLSTKAVYEKCMDIARRKWKWVPKKLK